MRIHLEHITNWGECDEINYATLNAKITDVSAQRNPNPGDYSGEIYRDITLSVSGIELLPENQRPKHKVEPTRFGVPSANLSALINGLGARNLEQLKGMEVIALYSMPHPNNPWTLIGFVRPQDKVELEK
ncbi:MAG: hypothetical protein ABH840_01515 [Nanoarchaeota archaeon]